jgi:hypothetical protein
MIGMKVDESKSKLYKKGSYIFKLFDRAADLFTVQNGEVKFSNPGSVEIAQHVVHHDYEGKRKLMIVPSEKKYDLVSSSREEYLFIDKRRFLSFINGARDLKNYFISQIYKEAGLSTGK